MSSSIENEEHFDHILDSLASGFSRSERLKANKAGAKKFEEIMKPKVPYDPHRKKGTHLRDTLVTVEKENGDTETGFTAKGHKGYIARFQNDGWDATDRNGQTHKHVPGKHFWEESQAEAKGKVIEAVKDVVVEEMDRKVRGQ